jgi:hypothetical protein
MALCLCIRLAYLSNSHVQITRMFWGEFSDAKVMRFRSCVPGSATSGPYSNYIHCRGNYLQTRNKQLCDVKSHKYFQKRRCQRRGSFSCLLIEQTENWLVLSRLKEVHVISCHKHCESQYLASRIAIHLF